MESPHQAGKIIPFVLLFAFFAILGWAVWQYTSSPVLPRMAQHSDIALHFIIASDPAMQISYNPALHKAVITISNKKCDIAKRNTCFSDTPHGYFIPQETDQELLWKNFENLLNRWRYNPLLLFGPLTAYVRARFQKRTDIGVAEFITAMITLSQMQVSDFALTYPVQAQTKAKKSRKPLPQPSVVSAEKLLSEDDDPDAPLRVEILNASGKKGLAQNLTQYLRNQSAKGLIKVDVMQYDTYRGAQKEKTEIIDYSSRLIQVGKLSHAIGFKGTIKTENTPKDIHDVTIILGKDFEMPL